MTCFEVVPKSRLICQVQKRGRWHSKGQKPVISSGIKTAVDNMFGLKFDATIRLKHQPIESEIHLPIRDMLSYRGVITPNLSFSPFSFNVLLLQCLVAVCFYCFVCLLIPSRSSHFLKKILVPGTSREEQAVHLHQDPGSAGARVLQGQQGEELGGRARPAARAAHAGVPQRDVDLARPAARHQERHPAVSGAPPPN